MKKIEQRMLNATIIYKAMSRKGWNNSKLLEALDKNNPAIVTKWLSGAHDFTQVDRSEISNLMGIDLLH